MREASYVKVGQSRKQALTDKRLDGWSIIDKVTPFVHAVGRVDGGRGSAILVSLPEPALDLRDNTTSQHVRRRRRQYRVSFGSAPIPSSEWDMDDDEADAGAPLPSLAVLLTTSSVLPSREAADGADVVFMEQPVVGTSAQWGREPRPFSVRIRSDIGFISSAPAPTKAPPARAETDYVTYCVDSSDEEGEEEIGYTLTYCEVTPYSSPRNGPSHASNFPMRASSRATTTTAPPLHSAGERKRNPALRSFSDIPSVCDSHTGHSTSTKKSGEDDLYLVKPLPLPLLLSAIPTVKVGDVHLLITHIDGNERHYIVQRVCAVCADYCSYADDVNLGGDFFSGGPVFNERGDFIGLQHRVGTDSICMFTTSIVRHLFSSNMLGICRSPISKLPLNQQGVELSTTDALVPEHFNQPFSIIQPTCVMDVGEDGNHLIDFKDLEMARRQREKPLPLTVVEPSYESVFKDFYVGFESLTHMLHAFPYCPAITEMVLDTMVSPKYRTELQTAAGSGGVGVILEIIDAHPYVQSVVQTSLATLSRMCLYESNLAAFVYMEGTTTVMEIMKEYPHQPLILQWGTYCLTHATGKDASHAGSSVDVLLRCSVVEFVAEALRVHGAGHPHLTQWLCALTTNVIHARPRAVTLLIQADITLVLFDMISTYQSKNASNNCTCTHVVGGVLTLLRAMLALLRHELPVRGEDGALAEGQLEDLKAYAASSPLTVSAYFLSQSISQALECDGVSLPGALRQILRAESGEAYNHASAELLTVCLDVLAVLQEWKLLPLAVVESIVFNEDELIDGKTVSGNLREKYAASDEIVELLDRIESWGPHH